MIMKGRRGKGITQSQWAFLGFRGWALPLMPVGQNWRQTKWWKPQSTNRAFIPSNTVQLHLLVTVYFHCSLLCSQRQKGHSQNGDIVPRTGNLPVILGLHFVFPPPPATAAQLLISPSRTSDLHSDPISYSCFTHFPTWQLLMLNSAFLKSLL